MKLSDIISRPLPPDPWSEGDNIPWNEESFSRRMLTEHLSEMTDRASRRPVVVDRHVGWIHETVLRERPSHVLDLCCGPGLYTSRLARLGHVCRGIDYSPASIEYAVNEAAEQGLNCTYDLADVRRADFGEGNDLIMLIFGEFNVFRREEASEIVRRSFESLSPGGALLLEPHTLEAVRETGETETSWFTSASGLFSDSPHIVLKESFWDDASRASTVRYFVIGTDGSVERLSVTYQGYSPNEYVALLRDGGFGSADISDALAGAADDSLVELCALLARRE
jgi:SAM-dependent methyltransferase